MKMTPKLLFFGLIIIFLLIFFVVVVFPAIMDKGIPSEIARQRTDIEAEGRLLYIENGCSYCHSQYVRPQDMDFGSDRISQAGDYVYDKPHLLGSERIGPDLTQAGGEHTDSWHYAHFYNPRYTRPHSVMPPFNWLDSNKTKALVAYVQSLGGKMADARMERQHYWERQAIAAYEAGPDSNINWIHANVPKMWRDLPTPYPADEASLARGEKVYQDFCIGCHGPVGDGMGPAYKFIYPPPLNFTTLKRIPASGGVLYYQIMNGITGTAMPYFKRELESHKIWDVSNYIAVYFMDYRDDNTEPRGIDASGEPVEVKKK